MPAATEEFVASAQRTQEATAAALQAWTDTAKTYAQHLTAENPLPHPGDVHAAVDTWFDLAARLLAEQRTLTKAVINASTEAVGTVTEQARAATAPFTAPVSA